MSKVPANGHYVQCPLCQGRGQFHRTDLIAKLSDPQTREGLAQCLEQLQQLTGKREEAAAGKKGKAAAAAAAADTGITTPREQEVLHRWQTKHFLWRRSPKE